MNKKMKFFTICLTSIFCVGLMANVKAQDDSAPRMGIKGGVNLSNLYVDDVDDENARLGFNVGLYGQILSSDVFALQPELLYTTKGSETKYNTPDETVKFNLNYLELPVLAVFKLGKAAEIHAGGYVSYLLNANIDVDGDIIDGEQDLDRDKFKTTDYGLVGGVGLNFGAIQVGARYNYGLVNSTLSQLS